MGLKELKWCLIKINLLLLLILTSCQNNQNDKLSNNRQLECVLNLFITHYPIMNDDEKFIYIRENQYWSDTTSFVSLYYSDIPPIDKNEGLGYKISFLNKFEIVHISYSFLGDFKEEFLMQTKLKWQNVQHDLYEPVPEYKYLNYSETGLNFIYDFKNKSIIDITKSNPILDEDILTKIISCN